MRNAQTIKKVILITNLAKPFADKVKKKITNYLENRQIDVQDISYYDQPAKQKGVSADLAISLGGDGTVLYSARLLAGLTIPVLAINMGTFGFIAETRPEEWQNAFEEFEAGRLGCLQRTMLEIKVKRDQKTVKKFTSLNDGVISAGQVSKLTVLRIWCDNNSLGIFRADGVIIATPTGSTAYSVAAGGPILSPEMEALIINPICPFTLSNRPLVVPGQAQIKVVVDETSPDVRLSVDGQTDYLLRKKDQLLFARHPHKVYLICSPARNFYDVLRFKLNWSGGRND